MTSSPTSSAPRLLVVRGDLGHPALALHTSPFRLGRDPAQNDCTLPGADPRISRQHLEVVEEFGRWVLIDHSRNGVWVNAVLVKQARCELQHGDTLRIGDTVELRFDDPNSTFAAPGQWPPLQPGLHLDPDTLTVWRDGARLDAQWSPQEWALLRCLCERPGEVRAYAEIVTAVWGADSQLYGRAHVQELVARVRRKLEPDPAHPRYVVTKAGHGYVLVMSQPG